ncbi:MAG: hypothetical protein ACM3L8_06785, partial [Verrucomicrobiota bacterium]
GLDPAACSRLARNAMDAGSAEDVRYLLREFGSLPPEAATSDSPGASEVVDPICRMILDADHHTFSVTEDGKTTYFCSPQCRLRFLALAEAAKAPSGTGVPSQAT